MSKWLKILNICIIVILSYGWYYSEKKPKDDLTMFVGKTVSELQINYNEISDREDVRQIELALIESLSIENPTINEEKFAMLTVNEAQKSIERYNITIYKQDNDYILDFGENRDELNRYKIINETWKTEFETIINKYFPVEE